MITSTEKYLAIGLMALILLLTFRDLMPGSRATSSNDQDIDEDAGHDVDAGHKYTRKSNQDGHHSMESGEHFDLLEDEEDENGDFGMPIKRRPIEKKIPKTNLRHIITGPTVKITYCYSCGYRKAFEEYSIILKERYPEMTIVGDNHPPPAMRQLLAQVLSMSKMAILFMVIMNINPFDWMGQPTPGFWSWLSGNKVYGCLMTFFICNTIESQLISTGAFEINYNDQLIWSKVQTGRIPAPPELFQLIDNQNLNRADIYNYKY